MPERITETFGFDALLVDAETPQAPVHDRQSARESKTLSGDGWRLEHLKQSLHWTVVWGVRIAGISMLALFVVRIWHMAAPDIGMWLAPERLQKIDSLLFSGFVGAFIARYLNQAMPAPNFGKNK